MKGCAFWLTLLTAAAAQDGAVFRADVALVHVDAEVIQAGRTLTGFEKADFRILDGGVARDIVHFSAEQEPLDVILVFDISGSMRSQVQLVATAAREALAELRTGDRIGVMVFNSRARVIAGFTDDLKAAESTIATDVLAQKFGGGTNLRIAVDSAALLFQREPKTHRRRAVLIVTDNGDVLSLHRHKSVVRNFWESDAVLSAMILPGIVDKFFGRIDGWIVPKEKRVDMALRGGVIPVVEETGGDAIAADDPASSFQDMVRRIRSRYSLYYPMVEGQPGSVRSVRVELSPQRIAEYPGASVRARKGYIVPDTRRP
jgi:VWFA-related protein